MFFAVKFYVKKRVVAMSNGRAGSFFALLTIPGVIGGKSF